MIFRVTYSASPCEQMGRKIIAESFRWPTLLLLGIGLCVCGMLSLTRDPVYSIAVGANPLSLRGGC